MLRADASLDVPFLHCGELLRVCIINLASAQPRPITPMSLGHTCDVPITPMSLGYTCDVLSLLSICSNQFELDICHSICRVCHICTRDTSSRSRPSRRPFRSPIPGRYVEQYVLQAITVGWCQGHCPIRTIHNPRGRMTTHSSMCCSGPHYICRSKSNSRYLAFYLS